MLIAIGVMTLLHGVAGQAQSLRGSAISLDRQNLEAERHGLEFVEDTAELDRLVDAGRLVPVHPNEDLQLKEDSYPYTRPAVRDFILDLARGYREACNEQLVVTSLTRPKNRQPRNAARRSVHPAGMAMDLRRTWSRTCRSWLEGTLLTLESVGILDATLEKNPIHYHVAVYPWRYREDGAEFMVNGRPSLYLVNRGDTLSKIARRTATSIDEVKQVNGLSSSRIYAGQVLKLPSSGK
jgi:hypothetical protein